VAIDVQRTSAYFVFAILVGLLFGSLVAARSLVLRGATVRVAAPRRVTIGDEVTFTVSCQRRARNGHDGSVALRVRGPFLPWGGTWTGSQPEEVVAPPSGVGETSMQARFVSRGLHHLDPFTAAVVAPLGLACGPREASDGVKVYVVPRIANVTRLP